jgi:hypothetical protein
MIMVSCLTQVLGFWIEHLGHGSITGDGDMLENEPRKPPAANSESTFVTATEGWGCRGDGNGDVEGMSSGRFGDV